jgi:hypothetical protein
MSLISDLTGDLRDPKYLDFISFAQHDTISTCMQNAPYVFDEAVKNDAPTKNESMHTPSVGATTFLLKLRFQK